MFFKLKNVMFLFYTFNFFYKLLFFLNRRTHYIPFDEETAKHIWHPRLSFFNLKKVNTLAGFGYRELNQYFIFESNEYGNNMEMDEIVKVTVYCDFDFKLFPFDDQECDLSLYDTVNTAVWLIFDEINNLCFENKNCINKDGAGMLLPDQYAMPYEIEMKIMPTRNWTTDTSYYDYPFSYSTVKFSLQRKSFGLLIGSFYIPSGLFALLSTGSFIINPEIVSACYFLCFKVLYTLSDSIFYV